MLGHFGDNGPKFYGSVTVSERGQVAIPAEARRDLDITHNTKLLVFSGPDESGLMFVKADSVTKFIAGATDRISQMEQMLESNAAEDTGKPR